MTRVRAHPADGEQQPWPIGAHPGEAEPELPVKEVLPHKGDQAERHGSGQHVKHARHVVDVQLATHDLVLLVVANAGQPEGLQLLHFPWKERPVEVRERRRSKVGGREGGGHGPRRKDVESQGYFLAIWSPNLSPSRSRIWLAKEIPPTELEC